MKALLIKKTQFWYNLYHNNVGIGSTNKSLQGYKLSQENCDKIFGVIDVDKLAEEWVFEKNGHKWSNNDDSAGDNYASFKEGFNKALELNQHKFNWFKEPEMFEVEIEMEKVIDETIVVGAIKGVKGSGHKTTTYKSVPKLDENGCLILKKAGI